MKTKVIAISGALEEQSPITNILKKCASLESKLSIELLDIKHVPLLNTDLFEQDFPQPLKSIREKVQKTDGLIFAIPDFFGKVSPAFKNIFDWLSYSPNAQHPAPIRGMPACLISAGKEDGTSVHKHLIQMSHFCRVQIMVKPTFHFSNEKLDNFRNIQNVSSSEIEELIIFLEYFSEFLAKKSKGT